MQRLVTIRFGDRNPISHTIRIGRIKVGHDRIDCPATGLLLFTRTVQNDSNRKKIVHLVKTDMHALHLAPNRIDRLGSALEVVLEVLLLHLLLDRLHKLLDKGLTFGSRILQPT